MTDAESSPWDYVMVGSGAGGGTLAARLAESGLRVFLLEAGGDARTEALPRLPDDYDVPGFHAFASENEAMSWNFRVRHYASDLQQARDPKFDAVKKGVLYPRAAALGGCTAHNAMIYMLPHDSDWDGIAALTGDRSWQASNMRRYAKRVEACHHQPVWRALRHVGIDPTRHGWDGWLATEKALPLDALEDEEIVATVAESAAVFEEQLRRPFQATLRWLRGLGDPNARFLGSGSFEGLCYTPLSTSQHRRTGTRERLLSVAKQYPDRLHIELDALATRVLFDDAGKAVGVEYLKGARLYRAHSMPSSVPGVLRQIHARREVILSGGAFNTPQLLMLSGIGAATDLARLGVPLRRHLPGVGQNLQDRYEVAVTHRVRGGWEIRKGARFEHGDPLWQRWQATRDGLYASSGAALALIRRSTGDAPEPDIFCMALPARFEGYYTGFSEAIRDDASALTWAVLKAHTLNRAGRVTLNSADPCEPPAVNFHYFEEGNDAAAADLRAVVDAIGFVRRLTAPLIKSGLITEELLPGRAVDSAEKLAAYVRDTAWGHHASCSCPIGAVEDGGVIDSEFRVHGVAGLRIVDASVFPRIPGIFVASAVYIVAEKAADVILRDARLSP